MLKHSDYNYKDLKTFWHQANELPDTPGVKSHIVIKERLIWSWVSHDPAGILLTYISIHVPGSASEA